MSKNYIEMIGLNKQCRSNKQSGPGVIKKIMPYSADHGILNAHKYKIISRNSSFSGTDKPIMLFSRS